MIARIPGRYLFVSAVLLAVVAAAGAEPIKQGMQPSDGGYGLMQRDHLGLPLPATAITGGPEVDICTSTSFSVPTLAYWDDNLRSYRDEMWVDGVQVSAFGENWNTPLHGASSYAFSPDAYAVPANTEVTIIVYAYHNPNFDSPSYISEAVIDCTTGVAVEITNSDVSSPLLVPTLSQAALAALALMLTVAATLLLRRQRSLER